LTSITTAVQAPELVEKRFRISARAVLPARFNGTFSFGDAYRLCCDWNSWHVAQDMAHPEEDEPGTYLEDL
jgi:hypothetical protein